MNVKSKKYAFYIVTFAIYLKYKHMFLFIIFYCKLHFAKEPYNALSKLFHIPNKYAVEVY